MIFEYLDKNEDDIVYRRKIVKILKSITFSNYQQPIFKIQKEVNNLIKILKYIMNRQKESILSFKFNIKLEIYEKKIDMSQV